jgi:hypothetical protein
MSNPTLPSVPVTKPYKAIAAAIGVTLTAAATAWAAVELALADGNVAFDEIGSVAAVVLAGVGTVRAVWLVNNPPKDTALTGEQW